MKPLSFAIVFVATLHYLFRATCLHKGYLTLATIGYSALTFLAIAWLCQDSK